jgi:hypothetical protein
MEKSFYDLDYIIEINEKRVEQYTSAYQQVLSKLTNIILIYSAVAIFLIPIIPDVVGGKINSYQLCCFVILLILPKEIAYLSEPGKYYKEYRIQYEATEPDVKKVDLALKASYIGELEKAMVVNDKVFKRKSSLYYKALIFGLSSTVPFLLRLGFHIFQKDDKIQRIEIVKPKINCNLDKNKNNVKPKYTDSTGCR